MERRGDREKERQRERGGWREREGQRRNRRKVDVTDRCASGCDLRYIKPKSPKSSTLFANRSCWFSNRLWIRDQKEKEGKEGKGEWFGAPRDWRRCRIALLTLLEAVNCGDIYETVLFLLFLLPSLVPEFAIYQIYRHCSGPWFNRDLNVKERRTS